MWIKTLPVEWLKVVYYVFTVPSQERRIVLNYKTKWNNQSETEAAWHVIVVGVAYSTYIVYVVIQYTVG